MKSNLYLIRHGFLLIFLALAGALLMPLMMLPRLAVSAHTIGMLSGLLLVVLGIIWDDLQLSSRQQKITYASWLMSSYANWGACLFGAFTGAGKMTPVAANGAIGSNATESVVMVLLIGVVVSSFVAVGFTIFGLRVATVKPVNELVAE